MLQSDYNAIWDEGVAAFLEYEERVGLKGRPGPCPYFEETEEHEAWWNGFYWAEDSAEGLTD